MNTKRLSTNTALQSSPSEENCRDLVPRDEVSKVESLVSRLNEYIESTRQMRLLAGRTEPASNEEITDVDLVLSQLAEHFDAPGLGTDNIKAATLYAVSGTFTLLKAGVESFAQWMGHQVNGYGRRRWSELDTSLSGGVLSTSSTSTSFNKDTSDLYSSVLVSEIQRLTLNGCEDRSLVFVYRELNSIVRRGDYRTGERLLASIPVEEFDSDVLVAFVVSFADVNEDVVPSKSEFFRQVRLRLGKSDRDKQRLDLVARFS